MFAKKNLVAAAALMVVAGVAQADVKLYGMVDMSVGSFEDAHDKTDAKKAGFRKTAIESGKMMTSYIGLAGSEDLGNGLKAEFALESFLAADTGAVVKNYAGGFWGRGSFVALNGGFGKVALGQYDSPLFTSGYTYNPFGSSMGFSPTMRHLYSTNAQLGFDTGFVNSVTYESPNFSGFSFIAQYAPKETTAAHTGNSYAAGATYAAGPLAASLTYVKGGNSSVGGANGGTLTGYFADQKVWDLGASYDFGVVKGFVQYSEIKTAAAYDLDDTTKIATILTDLKAKAKLYQIGASIPVTDKASVMVSYGESKFKETSSSDSIKDRVFSVGYDYVLSKRTDVYGVFTNNGHTALETGQTFAVGIKHNF
jgi:predicted porin